MKTSNGSLQRSAFFSSSGVAKEISSLIASPRFLRAARSGPFCTGARAMRSSSRGKSKSGRGLGNLAARTSGLTWPTTFPAGSIRIDVETASTE